MAKKKIWTQVGRQVSSCVSGALGNDESKLCFPLFPWIYRCFSIIMLDSSQLWKWLNQQRVTKTTASLSYAHITTYLDAYKALRCSPLPCGSWKTVKFIFSFGHAQKSHDLTVPRKKISVKCSFNIQSRIPLLLKLPACAIMPTCSCSIVFLCLCSRLSSRLK